MTQLDKLIYQAIDTRREEEKYRLEYYAVVHKIGERVNKANLINHAFNFSYPAFGITKFSVLINPMSKYDVKVLVDSIWKPLYRLPDPFSFLNELLKEIK